MRVFTRVLIKGENWGLIRSTGLPEDLHRIYTRLSLQNDEKVLLAGTMKGVFRSEDAGESWEVQDDGRQLRH